MILIRRRASQNGVRQKQKKRIKTWKNTFTNFIQVKPVNNNVAIAP